MIVSYIKTIPRPTLAPQGPRNILPKRKRQTKKQREMNDIPERILPRIKTIDFEGFKQKYKGDQISTRFPVNKLLINASIKAQAYTSACPPQRTRHVQPRAVRRAYSPMHEVFGRGGEGIRTFTTSEDRMRRKRNRAARCKVPKIPILNFTSKTPIPPHRRPCIQNSKSGNRLELVDRETTDKTSNVNSVDLLSRTASLRLRPAGVSEDLTPGLTEPIRVDLLPQEQVHNLLAAQVSTEDVDFGELADEPIEDEIQKLQAMTEADYLVLQSFQDPIEDEDTAPDLTVMDHQGCRTAVVPSGTVEAATHALTGMGMTEHLMQILNHVTDIPQRKSAPSLRQAKLDQRSRRIRLKRHRSKSPVPPSASNVPQTSSATLVTTQPRLNDLEIVRRKSMFFSAPLRVGLSRANSVGAMAGQQPLKEREKVLESKSVAALTIRMSICTALLTM